MSSLYILSINYKSTSNDVLSRFSFTKDDTRLLVRQLLEDPEIDEACVVSTCNRTEVCCSSEGQENIFAGMLEKLISFAGVSPDDLDTESVFWRYQDEMAVRHLFEVTAGLKSMILGEDQILGQVKNAYEMASEEGGCGKFFHTLFQKALAAAKKVKTDTSMSKRSVSVSTLSFIEAKKFFNDLSGKKILIIGARGHMGSIILKNALDIPGLQVFVTLRNDWPEDKNRLAENGELVSAPRRERVHGSVTEYTAVMYQQRYLWADDMDIIVSVTRSPHYTLTYRELKESFRTKKDRLLFDLALPNDISPECRDMENTLLYDMDDMKKLAEHNNMEKKQIALQAGELLKEYEEEFLKDETLRQSRDDLDQLKEKLEGLAERKGFDRALDTLLYRVRDDSTEYQFRQLMKVLREIEI